jgi:hypothetical protein
MGTMERYQRFLAGEDLEKLMAEATAAEAARNVSPKTHRSKPVAKKKVTPAKIEETED